MSHRRLLPALLMLLSGACAPLLGRPGAPAPVGLAPALDSLFADTALAHAHWGVLVRSAETGETLYRQDAEKLFVPASNMKILTGAAVLEGLGPDFRYRTEFHTSGTVQNGVLRGALVVRGSGDPTLSTRFGEDARAVLRSWADSLRAHGITRIAGSIVGVDSAFVGPPLGAGWAWDDLDAYYASEFGALQFNEGVIDIRVFPSREVGNPAVVVLDPPTQYVTVNNQAFTAAPGTESRIDVTRDPTGPGIVVTGQVAADSGYAEETVAVREPTGYFLAVLRETLREAGIAVEGAALDADDLPLEDLSVRRAVPLFTYHSPPLREILPAMLKPSQNWIAETLLRTLGRELRGEGSARAGAAAADSIFRSWGLDTEPLRLVDGSGLSRYNLVTPELLAGLLRHMRQNPHWELWYASLPVGGVDGTLARRMRGTPLEGNVHAKTGTLSGVRSLSGYLTTAGGQELIFSMMVNHHARSASTADRVIDAALLRIYQGVSR
jgi:D-alanyl-D-alanine carboxypeptidase/D-alanyl-D-alanine-endopeptidase (penicillin-binding protein 4)